MILAVDEWLEMHQSLIKTHPEAQVLTVNEAELKLVSGLQTPNKVLLVVENAAFPDPAAIRDWCIALDGIRDPGNMGTILRIADWFGIPHVVCSPDCTDPYSPKVVQAAMGAQLRVRIYEAHLPDFIRNSALPSIAAILGGEDIYAFQPVEKGILIIGNEAKGISEELVRLAAHSVTIPRRGGAESLNAGVSAGILCALLLGR
ncbi:MAG TPA: RNA methyltransferase [Chitinophagaceae bacterium]|nr:RNA methyltransferase [Chitinophagaceae bacterium]